MFKFQLHLKKFGSAKSASQQAMRATVGAMRVTRVMRFTVQMLRIFICFIYIRMRTLWTIFLFCFCFLFGEKLSIQNGPRWAKNIYIYKDDMQKFIKFQDFSKKNFREKHTAAPLLEWVSINTSHSLISIYIHVELHSRNKKGKEKEQHFNLNVLASRTVRKLRNFKG